MLLKQLIPSAFRSAARSKVRELTGLYQTGRVAFSQEGEDLLLARLLGVENSRGPGFYVDVGAHHPERYSNTMYFYQRGWRGINIDPRPGMASTFSESRPRDINLEFAIAESPGQLNYAVFNDEALNGCDMDLASVRNGNHGHRIEKVIPVEARRLDWVLDQYLPKGTQVDFLSVDVEGHDLPVLRSNAWDRYRPMIVLAEDVKVASVDDMAASEIVGHMRSVGYVPVSKCALTILFVEAHHVQRTELGIRVS